MESNSTNNIIARNDEEDAVLVRLCTDVFDTVCLVYHIDTDDEEVYVLGDMQSADVPETFDDVPLYDWYNIKDVAW